MVARLLAYNVADILQAREKIEGENREALLLKSKKIIDDNPCFRQAKLLLMVHGVAECKWIKESLRIHCSEKKEQRVSK